MHDLQILRNISTRFSMVQLSVTPEYRGLLVTIYKLTAGEGCLLYTFVKEN